MVNFTFNIRRLSISSTSNSYLLKAIFSCIAGNSPFNSKTSPANVSASRQLRRMFLHQYRLFCKNQKVEFSLQYPSMIVQDMVSGFFIIVFIMDFTHDFFNDIFHCNDTRRPSELIDNNRYVYLVFLEIP